MKYDSNMTQFHNGIIAALRHMLGNNSEIAKKFSPNDGSSAPLRDYLKQKYGKSYTSHIGNGMRYSCKTSTGFELTFDTILNNPGDKNLTLSWSQTAKFIRDNWDEVFKKAELQSDPIDVSAENQPSYIDKLREKYPKVSETDGWFDTVFCPSDLFDGDSINDPSDDKCDYTTKDDEACQKCWRERCPTDADLLIDPNFEEDYFEQYPPEEDNVPEISEEKSEPAKPTENQIVPQDNGEISGTFNYAVLSVEMGDYLKHKEQQLKNEYMNFTANCGAIFAEVQEKLAKDGHGTFIKWIESMGFKKDTVYRMIDVNKFRLSLLAKDENETQEIFDALPKYLQYDISKPSAPPELVDQVLNGDITTHKDYIALKKQLDEANKRAETEQKARESISYNLDNMEKGYVEFKNKYTDEYYKNEELEKRIKELESHSVSVAVHKDESAAAEISRLKRELTKAQQDIINASFGSSASDDTELISDFYETLHGSALSAIRSCADFAEKNGSKFIGRFRTLAEVINDCINEMEEF